MAKIELQGLGKRYGSAQVVHALDLTIEDGEFTVFVGPSGCGKSTTLRMIAGLEEISEGRLLIGGEMVNQREPKQRNIAMVFQNYAIYPHMTVGQNIGFGLYTAKLSKAEKQARILEAAKTLGLEPLLNRRPAALSGGQRQRVAIGRAMVRDPAAFLFDEPLSNLDAQLRAQMRMEIKSLHRRLGSTIVYVTHDQIEAMTMADQIVVMKEGRILQTGSPLELYENPADVFTARFIGSPSMALLKGEVSGGALRVAGAEISGRVPARASGPVLVGVRPHDLEVGAGEPGAGFRAMGLVEAVEPLGAETLTHIRIGEAQAVATAPGRVLPEVGSMVPVRAAPGTLHLFDAASEKALGRI
ncbi:ABC transporter ATP-binding protein [Neomegalonema perideroedes]|uniref:ABC transporter ATP-binding protein n=1 Tax=Neomegalonema perideroedes TaxID=217219 RepID=UPI000377DBD0|nr:sn-glycerol-3-phosphate ABC transporter ATP-binding protein UgpC [Neomegalonema perideroedes]